MGWILDESDALAQHEGYAASVAPDGRTSVSSNGAGFMVRKPDEDQIERRARREGRQTLLEEIEDLIPWDQMVGWQVMCSCGWAGPTWPREVTSPDRHDGTDSEHAMLPDGRTVDDAAYEAWLAHMEPLRTVSRIRKAADELAAARQNLDRAVLEARLQDPPASWGAIGRAAGMSRQAARDRWGSITDEVLPIEFDTRRSVAAEARLHHRDKILFAPLRTTTPDNRRPPRLIDQVWSTGPGNGPAGANDFNKP